MIDAYDMSKRMKVPALNQHLKAMLVNAVDEVDRNDSEFEIGESDIAGSTGLYVYVNTKSPDVKEYILEVYLKETQNKIFILTFSSQIESHNQIKAFLSEIYTSLSEVGVN